MKTKEILENWKTTPSGTISIDWQKAEATIGFALHENFKDYHSRILINQHRRNALDGIMKFNPKSFVKEYTGSEDGWLEGANANREFCEFTLFPLKKTDKDYIRDFVYNSFYGDWTGRNDFGHRAWLGEFILNTGQISMIFNNNTGKFEWVDFGYGYFDVYEENPYGIIADTAQEFLDKFEYLEMSELN